ncbi:histone acetyltransferase, partial [Phenoliferia sp. Uapishka_3]
MANSKRKSPPPSNNNSVSPSSKRARFDSPGSATPLPGQTLSSVNSPQLSISSLSDVESPSHFSSPEVELRSLGQAGKSAPGGGEARDDDAVEESEDEDLDLGLDLGDEEDDIPLPHMSKSVPSKQPRPTSDVLTQRNGNSSKKVPPPTPGSNGARAVVGGKGRKGEEALEHAVAAREEVERRRVEMGMQSTQGAKSVAGSAGTLASQATKAKAEVELQEKEEEAVRVKVEDDEVVVVPVEDDVLAPIKRERPAISEERDGIIRFMVVTNDNDPVSLIILTGLKNIFQKQLPKMPKEYIARLVFDRNHYSMAIVKRGWEVVGGITYRPFEARRFAEIVFCAITGTEQVKGYGQHLMNHLKDHVKRDTQCMHFLTYADNYAIGYFKKQGFTKEVGLDRSVWAGYIKDYEGGTIMHCSMLERIEYLKVGSILAQQKEVILEEIRLQSQSHVVHRGLDLFNSLPPDTSLDPSLIPGLTESGWTPEMDELTRRPKRGAQFAFMEKLLLLLNQHPSSWAFTTPVNAAEVTDYYDVIQHPMVVAPSDLATMDRKLESNTYANLDDFIADAKLIFFNCRAYNDPGSNSVSFHLTTSTQQLAFVTFRQTLLLHPSTTSTTTMEATRNHLNDGDLEVGYADIMQPHVQKAAATHAEPPRWLTNWEDTRPRLLVEMFGEFLGVFIYCFFGVGASAAFFITSVGKVAGFGSLLNIGISYAVGIILAIVICGPASGGHLSPCYTIAFWLFKGFPAKKVPFYLVAQVFGGFVGIMAVYGCYKQQMDAIAAEFHAGGLSAAIFTPSGPAGVMALFTNPGQELKYVFLVEFMVNLILSIAVFAVLDPSNLFVSFASAPFLIGIAYMAIIVAFAADSIALNAARDVGGRLACSVVFGRKCWPGSYAALSALTNIFATLVGAFVQTVLISDSARPITNNLPDPEGPSLRAVSRGDATSLRAISRDTTAEKRA